MPERVQEGEKKIPVMIETAKRLIWRVVDKVTQHGLDRRAKDIVLEMQLQALRDSAAYATRMMTTAHVRLNRFEVLETGINSVTVRPGLYLEFGVFRGRTLNYIARRLPNERIFGFDSFDGLPEDWNFKGKKGVFKISEGSKPSGLGPNVEIVEGHFANSLPVFLETHKAPIAFVHVDCDIYSSTKTVLEHLAPRFCEGTVIVFDEYFNYPGWEDHEFKAFQEYVSSSGRQYRYLAFCGTHQQVAVVLR